MTTENITTILNKILAMKEAKIVSIEEIAKAVGESPSRVYDWITQRTRMPHGRNGDAVLKLLAYAADMTLEIVKDKKKSAAYRKAFREVGKRFPVGGNKR